MKYSGEYSNEILNKIFIERTKQIDKHGFDHTHDKKYIDDELLMAACFCMTLSMKDWPRDWDKRWMHNIIQKDPIDRLIEAGALILAHAECIRRHEDMLISNGHAKVDQSNGNQTPSDLTGVSVGVENGIDYAIRFLEEESARLFLMNSEMQDSEAITVRKMANKLRKINGTDI